jgi:hypothetical protein
MVVIEGKNVSIADSALSSVVYRNKTVPTGILGIFDDVETPATC